MHSSGAKTLSELFTPGSVKVLYCYTIPNSPSHANLCKIGDATLHSDKTIKEIIDSAELYGGRENVYSGESITEAAHRRIKEQTNTAGITYNLEWAVLAVTPLGENDSIKPNEENAGYKVFRDHSLHTIMLRNGIKRAKPNRDGSAKEWFKTTPENALNFLQYMQSGNREFLNNQEFKEEAPAINLRQEQRDFVNFAKARLRGGAAEAPKEILCSAIMRFGKTISSYSLIKEAKNINKVLVLTHRPQVISGWSEDFDKTLAKEGYTFGSKTIGEDFSQLSKREKFVYFASMQDARGSFDKEEIDTTDATATISGAKAERLAEEMFSKNKELFGTDFDLIIVDEGHEGTLTALAEKVKENLRAPYWLHLSGTPFNIAENFDEDMIYEWNYIMERRACENFPKENPGESNPYDSLPTLEILNYDLSEVFGKGEYSDATPGETSFNFSKFFETTRENGKVNFTNPKAVHQLLGRMIHDREYDDKLLFPYETYEMKRRLAHTFWLLPTVGACAALQEMLEKHPYFSEFKIVNVAGDNVSGGDALGAVKEAIRENKYTITLSVGRLTTGVTVPEWTGVFLFSNLKSPMLYMQTIFRCKSSGVLPDGSLKNKGMVFDFAPDRALEMVAQVAGKSVTRNMRKQLLDGSMGDGDLEENLKEALEYMPIYKPVVSAEGARFQKYDVNGFMYKVYGNLGREVYNNGFENQALFDMAYIRSAIKDAEKGEALNKLRGLVGSSGASKTKAVQVNSSGLSEASSKLAKKPKSQVPPEMEKEWEEARKRKAEENRQVSNALGLMRAVSTKVPLLMFAQSLESFTNPAGSEGVPGERSQGAAPSGPVSSQNIDEDSFKEEFEEVSVREPNTSIIIPLYKTFGENLAEFIVRRSAGLDSGEWVAAAVEALRARRAAPGASMGQLWDSASGNDFNEDLDRVIEPSEESIVMIDESALGEDSTEISEALDKAAWGGLGGITRDSFPDYIDDESWSEFMPRTVTKDAWREIYKYFFNPIVFQVSCREVVHNVQRALDRPPLERVPYIAEIFKTFRNPDKETILTPWRVVSLQAAETLGGLRWVDFDGNYFAKDANGASGVYSFQEVAASPDLVFDPQWVDQGFDEFWDNPESTVFDINSKTALYPLYAAASFYHRAVVSGALRWVDAETLWRSIVSRQIFVNCRVAYSARIAERVLGGFDGADSVNASVVDVVKLKQFFDRMKLKKEFSDALWRFVFAPREFNRVSERVVALMAMDKGALVALAEAQASVEAEKFGAVLSNPPYQFNIITDRDSITGRDDSVVNVFQHFYEISLLISDKISMVFPGGRWMQRSKGCEGIADMIISTVHKINWYANGDSRNIDKLFETADIPDGVSVVLYDVEKKDRANVLLNGIETRKTKSGELLPLRRESVSIFKKGRQLHPIAINFKKGSSNFFNLRSNWVELSPEKSQKVSDYPVSSFDDPIKAYLGNATPGKAKRVEEFWIPRNTIKWSSEQIEMFNSWKVVTAQGQASKRPATATYTVVDNEHIVGESWLIVGSFKTEEEAINYHKYLKTNYAKYLLDESKGAKIAGWGYFLPDLEDYTSKNSNIDWSAPLDPQLYQYFSLSEKEIETIENS